MVRQRDPAPKDKAGGEESDVVVLRRVISLIFFSLRMYLMQQDHAGVAHLFVSHYGCHRDAGWMVNEPAAMNIGGGRCAFSLFFCRSA